MSFKAVTYVYIFEKIVWNQGHLVSTLLTICIETQETHRELSAGKYVLQLFLVLLPYIIRSGKPIAHWNIARAS